MNGKVESIPLTSMHAICRLENIAQNLLSRYYLCWMAALPLRESSYVTTSTDSVEVTRSIRLGRL